MSEKLYVLGMGYESCLSDGCYKSLDEAHAAAKKLQHVPHDNGDFHEVYTIGKIVPSSELAISYLENLTEHVGSAVDDWLSEVDGFNLMELNLIKVNQTGLDKLAATLKDILQNDTDYHGEQALGEIHEFSFAKLKEAVYEAHEVNPHAP